MFQVEKVSRFNKQMTTVKKNLTAVISYGTIRIITKFI